MKHYKDLKNNIFGFEDWQEIPSGLVEISKEEADEFGKLIYEKDLKKELFKLDYVGQRLLSYPKIGDFLDAWVKGDEAALEEYRKKCLEVKAKYPKI